MFLSKNKIKKLIAIRDDLRDYFEKLPIVHTNAQKGIRLYTDINAIHYMLPRKYRWDDETDNAIWNRYVQFCDKR